MLEISTLGSCVTRDIFRISDTKKQFKLKGNVGFISPYTMFSEPAADCDDIIAAISKTNFAEFNKRNAIMDLKGKAFDYLIENRSEWLIIDLMELRADFLKKNKSTVSCLDLINKIAKIMAQNNWKRCKIQNIGEEEIYRSVDHLADMILKYWKPENIIVVNDIPTNFTLGRLESTFINSRRKTYPVFIQNLHILNNYIRDKLGCHIIDMPPMQFVGANRNHTWGSNPCHYTDEVYRYLYYQICKIVFPDKKDHYECEKLLSLDKLKKDYYRNLSIDKKVQLRNELFDLLYLDNIYDYLKQLANLDKVLIGICIKDTAGYFFNDELQKHFKRLGLKKNLIKKFMVGYIAVINNGIVLHEAMSENNGYEEYFDSVDYQHLALVSKPYKSGNISKILINGIDYSVNRRGLNIVVFDHETQRVVDSVAFDTHVSNYTFSRKIDLLTNEELVRLDLKKYAHEFEKKSF